MNQQIELRPIGHDASVVITWSIDRLSARMYVRDPKLKRLKNLDIIYRGRRHGKERWFSFLEPTANYHNAEAVITAVITAYEKTPTPIRRATQESLH